MIDDDQRAELLTECIALSAEARQRGDHPFGALLADESGTVRLRARNSVETGNDITGHAELNLVRNAWQQLDRTMLGSLVLYSSAEPCPMCAGAIYWSGIRRVVYALSQEHLYAATGSATRTSDALVLKAAAVFDHGARSITVDGPYLEAEAMAVHEGFWERFA